MNMNYSIFEFAKTFPVKTNCEHFRLRARRRLVLIQGYSIAATGLISQLTYWSDGTFIQVKKTMTQETGTKSEDNLLSQRRHKTFKANEQTQKLRASFFQGDFTCYIPTVVSYIFMCFPIMCSVQVKWMFIMM